MRNLSEEEKKFLKELVEISSTTHNVFIGNIIDRELNNIDIFLDYKNVIVEYRFDMAMYEQNPDEFMYFSRDFSWKFIRYIQLLKYLEKRGLLFLYQEGKLEGTSRFGRLIVDHNFITSKIKDKDATSLILDFSGKTIVINQSLIDFVNNDFSTPEDIKHKESISISEENLKIANESLNESIKGLKVAKEALNTSSKSLKRTDITIMITVLIFIIGTIVNYFISNREPNPIKIDKLQLDSLKNVIIESKNNDIIDLNKTMRSIDSTNKAILKNLNQSKK